MILHRPAPDKALLLRTAYAALTCLEPEILDRPVYRRHSVWRRLFLPEREYGFAVSWMDDSGHIRSDRGYLTFWPGHRPDRCALVFRPGLPIDTVRTLAFQRSMGALLVPGADEAAPCVIERDPSHLSDGESMRLCRSVLSALEFLSCTPLPSPQIPDREKGYIFGACGESADFSLPQARQAGSGLCLFAEEALRSSGMRGLDGKAVMIRGAGPIARAAEQMAERLGARVSAPSETDRHPVGAVWFLTDDDAPLTRSAAEKLLAAHPAAVFEGAPLACEPEASLLLDRAGVLFSPAVAAGIYGSAIPGCSDWEAERFLRREMSRRAASLRDRCPESFFRGTWALALERAAEAMVVRGIV